MRPFIYCAICFVLMYQFVTPPIALMQGGGDTADWSGADWFFVVEQSTSMSGGRGHPEPNDPNGLRVYAPAMAIDILADDSRYFHPTVVHRVSFISFGNEAKIDLPLQAIEVNPTDSIQGLEPTALKQAIQPEDLGAGDILSAFQQLSNVLTQTAVLTESSANRPKIVVLIIDGKPSWLNRQTTLDKYQQELADKLSQLQQEVKFTLWVLALDDKQELYWPDSEAYWNNVSGNKTKFITDSQLPDAIKEVLNQTLPNPATQRPESKGIISLPPYLEAVTFKFHFTQPQPKIAIYRPDGQQVTEKESQVVGDDKQQEITITSPIHGAWRVVSQGALVEMSQTKAKYAVKLTNPPTMWQHSFLNLTFQISETLTQQPLVEWREYPLVVTATIRTPTNETWQIPLTARGEGYYQTTLTPSLDLVGNYVVSVIGEQTIASNQTQEVFSGENNFSVLPAEQVTLQLVPTTLSDNGFPQLSLRVLNVAKIPLPFNQIVQTDSTTSLFEIVGRDETGQLINLFAPMATNQWAENEDTITVGLDQLPNGNYYVVARLKAEPLKPQYVPLIAEQQILVLRQVTTPQKMPPEVLMALGAGILFTIYLVSVIIIKIMTALFAK